MPQDISRREFNRAAATLPLVGLPVATLDVSNSKSLRLQAQCHRIFVDGWHLGGDDWRLTFLVRVVQRMQADPRNWHARIMTLTDAFSVRLNERGLKVVRRNSNRLVAERATLPNGVAGLCLMLESAFPLDQQDDLWIDPTPKGWGEYTIPCNRGTKRFWIGEA